MVKKGTEDDAANRGKTHPTMVKHRLSRKKRKLFNIMMANIGSMLELKN
jgi:hypothetical protein